MRKRMVSFCMGIVLFLVSIGNIEIPLVKASEINGILVELAEENKRWKEGEYLLREDLKVYVTYDSGDKMLLKSEDFLLEQEQILLESGTNVITVKYREFVSYAEIFAQERKPVGLVGNLKENKKYLINSNINIEEFNIFMLYSDGEKIDVTGNCVIEGDCRIHTVGNNFIKIQYYQEDACYSIVLVVEGVEQKEESTPQSTSETAMDWQEGVVPTQTIFPETMEGGEVLMAVTTYPAIYNKEQPNPTEYQEDVNKPCTYVMKSSIKGIIKKSGKEKMKSIYTKQNVNFMVKANHVKKIQYQLVKKGKNKTRNWKGWKHKLKVKKQGKWILHLRIIGENGKQYIEKTNIFIIDKTKPIVLGVKAGKTYKKPIQVSYKDKISGIKSATLNGERFKQNVKITKNGSYRVKIVDKANNKKVVTFQIAIPKKKPTVTPSPTILPTEKPEEEVIPVTDIYCTKSIYLKEGEQGILKYEVIPSNATNTQVTFKSSNQSVAIVNENGRIKGKEEGTAYIVVRSKDNKSVYATCVVYITKE